MTTFGVVILLLIFIVVMYALMAKKGTGCCGGGGAHDQLAGRSCTMEDPVDCREARESDSADSDPVCGMSVDSGNAISVEHQGKRYLFCSDHCRKSFLDNPDKYL